MRLSETFPGEQGKERVITAYLNEIFYGHGAYGIAAAARIYFGVNDLAKLTPAQAALLAGLPKSPSTLDPFLFAVRDKKGRLVVPADAAPVVRRDWILNGLAERCTLDEADARPSSRPRWPSRSSSRTRRHAPSRPPISPGRSAASSTRSWAGPMRSRPAATRSSRRSTGRRNRSK